MEGIQKDYQKDIKKIIFLAPSGVEKISFIRKVIKNFEENDFDLKKNEYHFIYNGEEIKIPVFDIPAGNINFSVYKKLVNFNSSVVISVYAIDKFESLNYVTLLSKEIKAENPKNCKYILLGIKRKCY